MPVKTEEAVNGEESVVTSHANGGGKPVPVPGVETSAGSGHRKSKVGELGPSQQLLTQQPAV